MNRLDDMLKRYGEVCTRAAAARILGCCPGKVKNMIKDGRVTLACGGTMVDVRSIAEYITAPVQSDEEARQRRLGRKWSV